MNTTYLNLFKNVLHKLPCVVNNLFFNQVTKRESSLEAEWKNWNWRSEGDMMFNGAFFTPSGEEAPASYVEASSMVAKPTSVLTKTSHYAGTLRCQIGQGC